MNNQISVSLCDTETPALTIQPSVISFLYLVIVLAASTVQTNLVNCHISCFHRLTSASTGGTVTMAGRHPWKDSNLHCENSMRTDWQTV